MVWDLRSIQEICTDTLLWVLYLHLPDLVSQTPGAQLEEFSVFFCKSQDSQVLLNTLKNTKIQKLYSYALINHLLGIIR